MRGACRIVLGFALLGLSTAPAALAGPAGPLSGFGVDSQGRTVVALRTTKGSKPVVARFTADGRLDGSFSDDGILRPAVSGVGARISLQRGDSVIVGGNKGKFLVMRRYRPDGSPDPSFGGAGGVPMPYRQLERLLVQPGGHIFVLATRACLPDSCGFLYRNLYVERYSPSGKRLHQYEVSKEMWYLDAAALEPGGGFLVAGLVSDLEYETLDRFLPNGEYKGDLRGEAKVISSSWGEVGTTASALAITADRKPLIAANLGSEVWRLKRDGSFDRSFGAGGRAICGPIEGELSTGLEFKDLAVGADSKVVAAGGGGECGLVRYLPDGAPDPSFGGGDGQVNVEAAGMPRPQALALLPDGGVMLAGWDGTLKVLRLARYTSSGELDPRYGSGGITSLPMPMPG